MVEDGVHLASLVEVHGGGVALRRVESYLGEANVYGVPVRRVTLDDEFVVWLPTLEAERAARDDVFGPRPSGVAELLDDLARDDAEERVRQESQEVRRGLRERQTQSVVVQGLDADVFRSDGHKLFALDCNTQTRVRLKLLLALLLIARDDESQSLPRRRRVRRAVSARANVISRQEPPGLRVAYERAAFVEGFGIAYVETERGVARGERGRDGAAQRVDEVVRRDGVAVREARVAAEAEGVDGEVWTRVPTLGDGRYWFHRLRMVLDQPLVEGHVDARLRLPRPNLRVERLRLRARDVAKHLAFGRHGLAEIRRARAAARAGVQEQRERRDERERECTQTSSKIYVGRALSKLRVESHGCTSSCGTGPGKGRRAASALDVRAGSVLVGFDAASAKSARRRYKLIALESTYRARLISISVSSLKAGNSKLSSSRLPESFFSGRLRVKFCSRLSRITVTAADTPDVERRARVKSEVSRTASLFTRTITSPA